MKKPPKVVIAAWDQELTEACGALSDLLHEIEFQHAPVRTLAALNGAAIAADALVLEIDLARPEALADMRSLADSLPDRKIIAATRGQDGDEIRQLFRAGAADVLTPPFTSEAVRGALRQVLGSGARPEVRKGAVIAVVGAGGGVGATTVSLGLAAFLAREGPQSGSETGAAVLDLDLQFGDTDVALNLEPRSTLFEVIDAEARFDDRFLQSVMLDVGRGLKLLAPSPSVMPLETLRPPLAAAIVEAASHLAPFVVVDLPSAWTDATLTVLRRADLIVLVAAPTVASVRRARRVLTALAAAHVTAQRVCALNRVAGVVEAFERPARVGRALEIKIDASLPLEPGVARAQDRGELMLDAYPRSRFCRELRGLANKVRQQLSAPAKSGRTALLGEAA